MKKLLTAIALTLAATSVHAVDFGEIKCAGANAPALELFGKSIMTDILYHPVGPVPTTGAVKLIKNEDGFTHILDGKTTTCKML